MGYSRTKNSIVNTLSSFLLQFSTTFLSFIVRTVFIYQLDKKYLGLNGLFSDILSLLSLAELGIGTAIIYSMYQPFAKKDYKKIGALLNLYKKLYRYIGIVVALLGISLTPFLNMFITDMPNIEQLFLIYWLYLANTVISYFYIYKKSILIVDQKIRMASLIQIGISFLQAVVQIVILIVTHNFIFYLIVQIICSFLNNYLVSKYVDIKYNNLIKYSNEIIDLETKKGIIKNVYYMFVSKISSVVVTSTDNLLISSFVSTVSLGLYSNYLIFVSLVRQITSRVFEAVKGSVGNLIATESTEKTFVTYNNLFFLNFLISGFCVSVLFCVINNFIKLWIGERFILSTGITAIICINLYMRTIREVSLTYIDTYGLFKNIKWKSIAEAVLNLIASLFFVLNLKMGIVGVLLGTFTSNIFTNFWFEPYIIYKLGFNKSVVHYFMKFFSYLIAVVLSICISLFLYKWINISNIYIDFLVKIIVVIITDVIVYTVLFFKTDEFRYYLNLVKRIKK